MYYFCAWIRRKLKKIFGIFDFLGYLEIFRIFGFLWDIWKYLELLKNIWDISNIFGILQKCLGYLKNIWDIWWQDGGRYWKQIVALSPRLLRGDGRGGGIGECKERPGVSKRGCFLWSDCKILTIIIQVFFTKWEVSPSSFCWSSPTRGRRGRRG